MISEVFNQDCMIGMKQHPDKYFDLAVVDPPYGIDRGETFGGTNWKEYVKKDWDRLPPDANYFKEIKRVSVNQIIWGANYMTENIKPSMGWIYWDKKMGGDFSDGELAYTSFNRALKSFSHCNKIGTVGLTRFHPTQKPVALYKWILENYATKGDNILDTHLGSGSSRIAAYKLGFDFYACEIDKEYYEAQEARFKKAIAEPLFDQVKHATQMNWFDAIDGK
jgi:site-specific DNA-methyltransferase (adenine-specific)